jgi:SAM-dependent methyltransferase
MESVDEASRRLHEYYRRAVDGHVYIRETLELLFETVGNRVSRLGPRPRLLELGSHGGFITPSLLQRWPQLEIVVSDENTELVDIARLRVVEPNVRFDCGPLGALGGPFDLVVSVARHHHLAHGYLNALHRVMKPDSVYVVADELCPEYCTGAELERIEGADTLHVSGGYVFTSHVDWRAFQEGGVVPPYALELEDKRRRALWSWYRFVVDHAVERGYFDIAAGELQSARDDFVTGSEAEHKFSPVIVEREFELARFRRLSKRLVGPRDDAARQGMFVYEFGRA